MSRLLVFIILFLLYVSFSIFVYTKGTESTCVMNEKAYEGKKLYQKHNCAACHQVYGLGGYLGPELTDIVSKPGKTPQYLKARMNTAVGQMPSFNLNETERDQILEYLIYINSTVPSYKRNETAVN